MPLRLSSFQSPSPNLRRRPSPTHTHSDPARRRQWPDPTIAAPCHPSAGWIRTATSAPEKEKRCPWTQRPIRAWQALAWSTAQHHTPAHRIPASPPISCDAEASTARESNCKPRSHRQPKPAVHIQPPLAGGGGVFFARIRSFQTRVYFWYAAQLV